jgi:lysozyme
MLSEPQWALIFGAAKRRGARWADLADVNAYKTEIEVALATAPAPADPNPTLGRQVSPQGIKLIQSFEGCRLDAYPDPGTGGDPWTIGWGSTGENIRKGVRWTQEQADARFIADLNTKYGSAVDRLLGDTPTTQAQFDAMVCLTYNIGIAAFTRSSVLRLHKAGDHVGAARAFLMWNKAGGQVMRGLTRRRMAESELYSAR